MAYSESWWQSVAALVQAGAALAMWRATANLVTATRQLTLSAVQPDLSVSLPISSVRVSEKAVATVTNNSLFPVTEVCVTVSALMHVATNNPVRSYTSEIIIKKIDLRDIPAKHHRDFNYWELSSEAVSRAKENPLADGDQTVLEGMQMAFRFNHGITGKLHGFDEIYRIEFSAGELKTRRIRTSSLNPQ